MSDRLNAKIPRTAQEPIIGALISDDIASACGITVRSSSPIFALARQLIACGHDRSRPLHLFRGDTLAVCVSCIGEAAGLELNSKGSGFIKARQPVRAASPVRPLAISALTGRSAAP
jgi:hypothetical protein